MSSDDYGIDPCGGTAKSHMSEKCEDVFDSRSRSRSSRKKRSIRNDRDVYCDHGETNTSPDYCVGLEEKEENKCDGGGGGGGRQKTIETDEDGGDEGFTNISTRNRSQNKSEKQTHPSQYNKKRPRRETKTKTSSTITTDSRSDSNPIQSSSPPVCVKDYACPVCHKVFLKASDVPRHMKIHTGEIFTCEFCDKAYSQKQQLTRHVRDRHWKVKVPGSKMKPQWRVRSKEKVQCKFCDKWLHRCSVVRHVRNVHLKEIAEGADKEVSNSNNTAVKLSTTRANENVSGKVADTDKDNIIISNTTSNYDNVNSCSKDVNDSVNNSEPSNSIIEINKIDKTYNNNTITPKKIGNSSLSKKPARKLTTRNTKTKTTRRVVASSSNSPMSRNKKVATMTNSIEDSSEGEEEGGEEKEREVKVETEDVNVKEEGEAEGRLWKCPVCSIIFIHISELKIHLTIHAGELPYKCRMCPAKFAGREKFVEHSKVHQNRKESKVFHVCCICNKSFTRKSSYLTHTLLVHKRERKFQCDLCGKAYGDRKTLRLHHRRFHLA